MGGLKGSGYLGENRGRGGGSLRPVDNSQKKYRENGADGTKGDQAETVAGGVFITAVGGDAETQRHDEGNGDRAGGDAAGIKGDWNKIIGGKEGQNKDYEIEDYQQPAQSKGFFDALGGDHQKEAYAHRYRED